jgi:cytoskeletal protein CcmA (bactofilin family)
VWVAIFGKNDTQGQASAVERAAGATAEGAAATASQTVIGPKARFVGEMSGDEDILVQGRIEGNVQVNRKVTIAASGEVEGDVHARAVIVGGRVHGQIRADERAELLASASVQGNVNAPKVVIAEGAQLQGSVAMATPATEAPADAEKTRAEEK